MDALNQLVEGPQTRIALGLTQYQTRLLLESGEIVRTPKTEKVVRDGKPYRGRPRHIFRLSDKARKRIKRANA